MMIHEKFYIDDAGWINRVKRVYSPNFDERPSDTNINLIVIHSISLPPGEYGGPWIDKLFTNSLPKMVHPYFTQLEGMRVSAHLLIRRNGVLVQYVPLHHRAWHAGISIWEGRPRCNDYSIGIELEGVDTILYTDIQYTILMEIVQALMTFYPKITLDRIVGHCDIAPGRKTDPGPAFDWTRLRQALHNVKNPTAKNGGL
ncbi:1,6-anhydro-N-acetylmuramoyl-L-alanine amidase [Gammaproteobacteria bacterium]